MNYTKTPVLVILFGILTVVTVLVALTVASPTFGHQHYSSVNTANGTTSGSDPAWPMFNANPANTGHIDTSGPTSNVTIGWRLELADMDEELTFAAPTVVGGTVYVGASTYHDGNGKVYAVDAESGAVRWTTPVAGSVTMTPAVADGKVNVRTSQDKVYALDAKTGEKLWWRLKVV